MKEIDDLNAAVDNLTKEVAETKAVVAGANATIKLQTEKIAELVQELGDMPAIQAALEGATAKINEASGELDSIQPKPEVELEGGR